IRVPTNWEMQGFGQRIYTNSKHPWGHKNWPLISPMDNPVGIYRKKITVPEGWNGMDVRIHFGGVTSAFYLYVNGAEVGYSQGSRTPAEFDLTPYLAPGENTVILKVFRWSDGSYLESQDGWRLSGIHRDVLLLAEPKAKITDFTVRTELDAKYEDAVLAISPEVSIPAGEDPDAYRINAALYDDGSLVKETSISAKARTNFWYNQRFAPVFDLINLAVENPKKWSAEYPNLYTLVLSLRRADGTVVEAKSTRVGFRKFETHGGVLTVNGQAIKLYGVNRHDHNAKTGKTVSYADMRRDLELLKRYNFNAVRCSHYPNNSAFYDLCDEYGIYVMDEANVETHGVRGGGGELASHPAWTSAFVDRAVRMYERDKNHPSIFSWSLGNESGVGANHSAMAGYLKWKDPERLIHFEPAGSGGGKLSPQ
ncbi:MAG: glycoside hydrolase family 2 TIM barrel-domain containing protein, partial [Bacteroidota bacterium]